MKINSINSVNFKGLWEKKPVEPIGKNSKGKQVQVEENIYHPFADETQEEINANFVTPVVKAYNVYHNSSPNRFSYQSCIIPKATVGEKLQITKAQYEEYEKLTQGFTKEARFLPDDTQNASYKAIAGREIGINGLEKHVAQADLKYITEPEEIFNYFGIKTKRTKDDKLILSHYGQPSTGYTFKDLGVDEEELFKDVVAIQGDANFRDSNLTELKNLRIIKGGVIFSKSKITDLGDLEIIGKDASFTNSKITSLGKVKEIGGRGFFQNSKIKDLGALKSIGGANFEDSEITDLGGVEIIKGDAYFKNSKIETLGALKEIGGYTDFRKSKITDLGNLQMIKGGVSFEHSSVINLGKLTVIGGSAIFDNSKITDLKDLKSIEEDAYFMNSQITSLGGLTYIGGDANFADSKVEDLGALERIGEWATFTNSEITSLKNLREIGSDADFSNSKVTDLGALEHIWGSAILAKHDKNLKPKDFKGIADKGVRRR